MEQIEFKVKGGRDIAFVGEEVAYEHDQDQDVAYRIYVTEKGNWFFAATSNEGFLLHQKVFNNKSTEELVAFFGYSDIAKSLYQQLGVDTTQRLDI
ncbi:hypothetical protein RA231_000284 [Cronobacter turicensis]|nr:hypothetical protein [Cronobacter turicensis]EKY1992349.1 hypothetical protein [Cronobacter turicensis]